MRILFLNQRLGAFGGAETYIRLCAEELRDRGYGLGLVYTERTGKADQEWEDLFPDRYPLTQGAENCGVRAALADFRPDICYVHNLDSVSALEAAASSGVPFVRLVHDHSSYCLRQYKYNYFTRKPCSRSLSAYCVFPCLGTFTRNRQGAFPVKLTSYSEKQAELKATRKANLLLVYSDYMRQELIRNGCEPDKIVKHSPLRDSRVEIQSSFNSRNLILFAGQIIRGKGVDVLLRALAQVEARLECVILGEGSHRNHCEKICRRLGLSDRVTFAGYLPQEAASEFYCQASVFAVSSVWPEPFGLSGPEAMRHGLPVVAFDSGGIREWLVDGENGFLVPWMDTAAFASKIDFLLRNKAEGKRMGQNGRERVSRAHSPARHIQNLEQMFVRLSTSTVRSTDPEKICNETTALNVVPGNSY